MKTDVLFLFAAVFNHSRRFQHGTCRHEYNSPVAKASSIITLNPDWKFKVMRCD